MHQTRVKCGKIYVFFPPHSFSLQLNSMQHFLLVPIIYGVIECVNSTSIPVFPMCSPQILSLHQQATGSRFYKAKQHAIYWVHKFKPTYLMVRLVHRFCLHIKYSFTSENHRLLLAWKSDTLSTIIQLLCADCGLHVFLMKTCTINGNTRKCRNHCYSLRFVLVTNFVGLWTV